MVNMSMYIPNTPEPNLPMIEVIDKQYIIIAPSSHVKPFVWQNLIAHSWTSLNDMN